MSALSFIAGMGAGAFVCAFLLIGAIRFFARDQKSRHEEMHTETLIEFRQRNTLLAAQNAIFAALAKEETATPSTTAAVERATL